jgi:hypothetical protein
VDDDSVVAIHREVGAPLVEVGSLLVDAHARGADEASQVALCQAWGDGSVPFGGSLSALLGEGQ